MSRFCGTATGVFVTFLLLFTGSAFAAPCSLKSTNPSITICTPSANATVTNPVSIVAGSTDSAGVIAMAIYVDNTLVYKANGNQISSNASFNPGSHHLVVQLWDNAGRIIKQSEYFTVSNSAAPTISFGANPTSITAGQSSTLNWSTSNATSVTIDNGIGSETTTGSVAVSPTTTTTYTLTATGPGGTASAQATVVVGSTNGSCTPASPAPSVTICSPANGSTITSPVHLVAVPNSNNGVVAMAVYFDNTLKYKANVTSVDQYISTTTGSHYIVVQFWDRNGNVPAKASEHVTVSGANPVPTISFSANPATVTSGQSSTLTWSTANATSVTIDNGVGSQPVSGSVSVSPATTTTYTLTATGPGGSATAQATVTVTSGTPPPTISFSANPTMISAGGSSTLTWTTTNATSVSIDNGIGSQPTSGNVSVSPSANTTYTLTATGPGGTSTARATVTVGSTTCTPASPAPSVTICSPTNGSTVPSPVHVVAVPNSSNGVIAMAVYFDNTLQYKGNVSSVDTMISAGTGKHYVVVQFWDKNGNVPAKASLNITVGSASPPPSINFSASPTTITSGQTSTLTWTTTNATSVTIDNGIGSASASGAVTVTPTSTTTYTLTASGPGGTATAHATVTVSGSTPPPTISFSANPSSISAGGTSTLTWSTTNATSVSIDNGIGSQPVSGSVAVSPSASTTYTLTATGAGGTSTAKTTVTVGAAACTPAKPAPSVTICSPANGATVPSPVHLVAVPNSNNGVIAMAVYFDNTLKYKGNVTSVDQYISAGDGSHYIVVQFWDKNGNVPAKASVNITVSGTATPGLAVAPQIGTIYPNETQQFTAKANGSDVNVTWSVDGVEGGSSSLGTISTSGLYTAPGTISAHTIKAVSTADSSVTATAVINVVDPNLAVLTYHNDQARTGANTSEQILTPANVNGRFGKLASYSVDGQVYAQPLYVPDLTVNGSGRNFLYVATENDSMYAFDADGKQSAPYWKMSLLGPGQSPASSSDTEGISPKIGVTGTPVIDRSNNALYVVSMVATSSGNQFWLHALDLLSGSERFGGPVRINPTVNGSGADNVNGVIRINGGCYQRPGLALVNGNVYVSFGHCSHGWVVGYSASSLVQTSVFNSSPNGKGAAIWMSGGAPAVDSSNNLYVMTGVDADSTVNSGYSDAFLKLSPSLSLLDYFMVSNNAYLTANDADLGSGSPIVLPDNSSAHPHELVGAGKDGRIFLVDRDNMGKFDPNANHVIQVVQSGTQQFDNFFDTPAYWNGNLYYHAENDVLRQFKWTNGLLSTSPYAVGSNKFGTHGATPSVSANGTSDGIVWELQVDAQPNGPAILRAYDANNVASQIYNSANNSADTGPPAVKFTVPTVVNGKVYVGGGNQVAIYGLTK